MGFEISFLTDFLVKILTTLAGMSSMIILLGMIVIGVAYIWIINKKYPVVKILLFDRGTVIPTERRRVGDMLVKAGIPDLMFSVEKLVGEDIKKFQFVRQGKDKIYFAQLGAGDVLLPIRIDIDNSKIYNEALVTGRQVAMEYINLIDEVNKTLDKTNPLIVGILTVLPLAIVVLIMVASNLSVMDFISKQYTPLLQYMDSISANLNSLADKIGTIPTISNSSASQTVYG